MPIARIVSPTKLLLPDDSEPVKRFLTFQDRGIVFLINKAKKNFRWKGSDPEGFLAHMEDLKSQLKTCLVKYDEDGRPYTYSGLAQELQQRFKWEISKEFTMPASSRIIPWANIPFKMFYYQEEAVNALIAAQHGAISLSTGAGKSLCLAYLAKNYCKKTLIFMPFHSIAEQLYKDFVFWFGKKYVGLYAAGKKEADKLIVIGTTQSLMKLTPDSKDWEELSKTEVLMSDESHSIGAAEFQKVATGVGANASYRFFVSATQVRSDGSEMLLKGLTGPIVYSKEFRELADQGFLAKPIFTIFTVPSFGTVNCGDAMRCTRNQMYNNPHVQKIAAQIAEKMVNQANLQVLILVEEFRQALGIMRLLHVAHEFAHGGASKDAKEFLPEKYWKCDVDDLVARFNSGEIRCLIGTSAISTGVNLKPVGALIYLQGGASEVRCKQSIGRGTRVTPDKKEVFVVDFNVSGSDTMEHHLLARVEHYKTMGEVNFYNGN